MMLLVVASAFCVLPSCSFEADKVKMDIHPQNREAASDVFSEDNVTMSNLIPNNRKSSYYARLIGKTINSAWYNELQKSVNAIPFMKRLAQEQAPTERAKWYSSRTPEEVLSEVRAQLGALAKGGDLMEKIALDDLEYESKVGPQGGHPAIGELMPKLCEYFGLYTKERAEVIPNLEAQSDTFKSKEWLAAKQAVIKKFNFKRRLRPASTRSVIEQLRKNGQLSTNCGFVPGHVFEKRHNPEVINTVERLCNTTELWKQPAFLAERSTRGKTRFIFMASMATNVKEQQYLFPLMDQLRKLGLSSLTAWEGNDYVREAITKSIFGITDEPKQQLFNYRALEQSPEEEDKLPYDTIISTDFTGMDQRFNAACVREIFSVIKEAFQPTYWKELDEIASWVSNVPVLFSLEDGSIYQTDKEHGMPSGSGYTNGAETIFDEVMWELAKAFKNMNQGDDSVAKVKWSVTCAAKEFSSLAGKLGMTANADKQLVSKVKAHYLQRYYYRNYFVENSLGGVYPIMLATNSLLFPERWHNPKKWNAYMETIRNLMICENTCDHPLFNWYTNFVGKGDKYIKDFLKLSRKELSNLEAEARSLPGFVPSYNQEKQDKHLYQFKTYQNWLKDFA